MRRKRAKVAIEVEGRRGEEMRSADSRLSVTFVAVLGHAVCRMKPENGGGVAESWEGSENLEGILSQPNCSHESNVANSRQHIHLAMNRLSERRSM